MSIDNSIVDLSWRSILLVSDNFFFGFQEVSDDLLPKGVIYKDDNLKNVQIKYNQNVTTSGVTNGSYLPFFLYIFYMFLHCAVVFNPLPNSFDERFISFLFFFLCTKTPIQGIVEMETINLIMYRILPVERSFYLDYIYTYVSDI